eukprot:jgi/Chlat1/1676/Chrsp127S01914
MRQHAQEQEQEQAAAELEQEQEQEQQAEVQQDQDDEGSDLLGALNAEFQEPQGFFKEKASGGVAFYDRPHEDANPPRVRLGLTHKHSLWGHQVWNAARVIADRVESGQLSSKGKRILELGAGAGLPSIICALNGASVVVATDYATDKDTELVDNLARNCAAVAPHLTPTTQLISRGFVFGQDPSGVLSCEVWVAFSHHDPLKAPLDLNFFTLAVNQPFRFEERKVCEVEMKDLFEENDGLDHLRNMVHFHVLRWRDKRQLSTPL